MTNTLFISLQQTDDVDLLGTKGKNLHILSRRGFNVPLTYCITNKAYERLLDRTHLRTLIQKTLQDTTLTSKDKAGKISDSILAGDFPEDLFAALMDHGFLKMADSKYAVRSSSNLEDLPGTSFAGLYDSYLNVQGIDDVLTAIKKCWASLWSERAFTYRETHQLDHMQAAMAVLIQPMVDALYSGVCFTKNPIEENTKMYLEYSEGLGEDLLSGRITPYSCEIETKSHRILHLTANDKRTFSDEMIRSLSDVFHGIEIHFECPQDIEWAITADTIYILQTRPIVTKSPLSSLNQIWTRANIGEVLPYVVTPLTWDIFRATLSNAKSFTEKAFNDIENGVEGVRQILGRGYIRLDHFYNSFCYLPTVTPQVMTRALGVNLPELAENYTKPSGPVIRLSQIVFLLDSLRVIPRLRWMIRKLPPPAKFNPHRIDELLSWTARCFRLHIKVTAYAIGTFGVLSYLLKRWLPTQTDKLLPELLIGHEDMQTSAQGVTLWKLVQYARANSALADALNNDTDWSIVQSRLSGTKDGREFLGMFQSFLDINGARAAGEFELSIPRWREDPSFVLRVLQKYFNSSADESNDHLTSRRCRQQKAAEKIKASLPPTRRFLFSQLLTSYSEYATFRENVKYLLIEGYAAIRQYFLAVGTKMVARGIVENIDDIFFLKAAEILSFTEGKSSIEIKGDIVAARKEQYASWKSQIVSEIVVGDHHETAFSHAGTLKGIGCSPGIAEGFARVLSDTSETDALKPGEILVTPHTDPGWTPLFLICKGLVTEIGGFLSHGATVAREYGIPAVVNVNGATKIIQTGDFIRVDGTRGLVKVLEKE